ncbi:MAG: DUF465 domain-containing protein [Alphaproteobacteria bacterium]|nr:DUF465 domain-containing protein [Rhodospirillales bacterium]MCW9045790.1 DUF465 domain-containing protein [Alphaproteobacteria bacterium]
MENIEALNNQLEEMRAEHRSLDEKITQLIQDSTQDALEIQRLKKRKLKLKDIIVKIENDLLPDIIA